MTTITANIIKHSISKNSPEIATLHLRYPRLMHADFMTHRVFSRNAASNRAMPTTTIISNIENDLVLPLKHFKNQKGMYGSELLNENDTNNCNDLINSLWKETKEVVLKLDELGLHKQNKNRYLEAFQHIDVLLTTTEFENFFNLRCEIDAQPEIQELGNQIRIALKNSTPTVLQEGEWHLPFITDKDRATYDLETLKKCSTARNARISYLKHDKNDPDLNSDLELFNDLYTKRHESPFEHIVRPITEKEFQLMETLQKIIKEDSNGKYLNNPKFIANHNGWVSFRRELENGHS
jgi:thymidylate synthase ThyX